MANYVNSITVDNVIDALVVFVTKFMPTGSHIVRAQVNRVPMPKVPCAVLTEMNQTTLEWPTATYDYDHNLAYLKGPTRIDIQVDIYGQDNAGEIAKAVQMYFQSQFAYILFPENIRPLYSSEPIQSPLVTGEEQYESRWTLTLSLQYNPSLSLPIQSANADITVNIFQADTN
jgi:hypothetical protein